MHALPLGKVKQLTLRATLTPNEFEWLIGSLRKGPSLLRRIDLFLDFHVRMYDDGQQFREAIYKTHLEKLAKALRKNNNLETLNIVVLLRDPSEELEYDVNFPAPEMLPRCRLLGERHAEVLREYLSGFQSNGECKALTSVYNISSPLDSHHLY
jgi:hypothetical protein